MKYQRGFTIVELILVIVIIGILAAVVGPRFFDNRDFDERFYFEEVLSAVRYAQKLAVASGCYIQVSRGSESQKFLLHRNVNCDNESANSHDFSGVITGVDGQNYSDASKISNIPKGLVVETTPKPFTLIFGPLGCIPDKAPGTCAPKESNRSVKIGNQFAFTVHAATGFIEVDQ
ncbi:prepilin-type N-terminal cleavage/methylation domain-containing protein [Stutzerimonas xanthomarina]|uniref:prepilin-type N-terminal cleavage/methylation domain-containing protein n=1 Tax=Stutzerimonas xanthomarina TaxID=271420 RepID=UPI003AA98251